MTWIGLWWNILASSEIWNNKTTSGHSSFRKLGYKSAGCQNCLLIWWLDEEIYMQQPEGFIVKGQENKVYKLKKAIYGLKQASSAWNKQANKSLKSLGFKQCLSDSGIYIRKQNENITICVIYVDDILFMGSSEKSVLILNKSLWRYGNAEILEK